MTMVDNVGATSPKPKRPQVAEHNLLLADGTVTDSEEKATGISYLLLENKKLFTWQSTEANPAEILMLAIFGAKTLATNITSAVRNNEKNPADADTQMGEIVDRFALIRGGKWIDTTREPGAPRVDRDKLAEAIIAVMIERGSITAEARDATLVERRARLDTDAAYMADCRAHPVIAGKYNELVGRKTVDLDKL